jgi:hypothetical protein
VKPLVSIALLAALMCALGLAQSPSKPRSRLTLRVSPQVGFEPLDVAITATRHADPSDRLWTVSLVVDGEDEQFPLFKSEVSLEGETGDTLKRILWEGIPAGSYWVLSCVAPGPMCERKPLVVSTTPQ